MSFHIVSIDSPQCSISCRAGQLGCKTAEGERKLPIEDVASIIITSFSAQIHSHLFLEVAKHGVALIICEAFKPVSLVGFKAKLLRPKISRHDSDGCFAHNLARTWLSQK